MKVLWSDHFAGVEYSIEPGQAFFNDLYRVRFASSDLLRFLALLNGDLFRSSRGQHALVI